MFLWSRSLSTSVFMARGATIACASLCKMAAMSVLSVHTTDFDEYSTLAARSTTGCAHNVARLRYLIRKPCCVHLFPTKRHLNAQRSHVTSICSTILLTFSLVKANGDRPRTWCTFRELMPGGDTEPPPGPV